jgi:predicted phosphohydrolase
MGISIYAIGDLHLSSAVNKPMDVFGGHWTDHWTKIREDWLSRVGPEDIVLIPGDISWAMKLDDARPDLDSIGSLPGKKVMIRGNHDYWWSSLSKVKSILPPSISVLQNNSLTIDGYTFCGTRGWINPCTKEFGEQDAKIYRRELQRLKLSLDSTIPARDQASLIVLLHYPPFGDKGQETEVVNLLRQYQPTHVVYGHLHGESANFAFQGIHSGIMYHLVSCDYLDYKLKQIV